MSRNLVKTVGRVFSCALTLCLSLSAVAAPSLTETMDTIISRFYEELDSAALSALNDETILELITDEEKELLATRYWYFDVDVPVIVSVIRHTAQPRVPFWLEASGFEKTELTLKNDHGWQYEIWQKKFDAGHVALGIPGFDRHLGPYLVTVGSQKTGETVKITNLFPATNAVIKMEKGAWGYRDWSNLKIEEVPESLVGQQLLTTSRGRAWEANLVGAFRTTEYPSTDKPDQILLTWSEDPRTTQTVQWRTKTDIKKGFVQYRRKEATGKSSSKAKAKYEVIDDRLLQNDRYIHHHTAVLRELQPNTTYLYRVGFRDAWSDEAEFTTAPDKDAPFSFVYFGDTHRSPEWGKLLDEADKRFPEVAFYTIAGDVVNTGLYRGDWDLFFEYSKGVFNHKSVMMSLGNHDEPNGLGAWMPFALTAYPENGPEGIVPEGNYSFRYGNALFLMLDVQTKTEIQAKWLEEQLANTDATWKFVTYHFPLYDLHEENEYKKNRRLWIPIFDKYHLDIMFQAHVHYYVRSKPMKNNQVVESTDDGTLYLISLGTSGHKFTKEMIEKRFGSIPAHTEKFMSGGLWYQKIDIDGNKLTYTSYDRDGKVVDEFTINKPTP